MATANSASSEPLGASAVSVQSPHTTVPLSAPEVAPNPLIFYQQATYPLNVSEFQTLTKSGESWLKTVGIAIAAFAIAQLLPFALKAYKNPHVSTDWITDESKFDAGLLFVGLLMIVIGAVVSLERWMCKRRIRQHYKANPGQTTLKP
jgi:hypothetical protein